MVVSLRELTRDTWHRCIDLEVREEQKDLIASNLYSLAEAQFYPGTVCRAVYVDETMVGFVMYGPDAEYSPEQERSHAYALVRLMIDKQHQGKGYGSAALREVIAQLQRMGRCRVIYSSTAPENHVMQKLFRSLGFQPTGEVHDGEVVLRLPLEFEG